MITAIRQSRRYQDESRKMSEVELEEEGESDGNNDYLSIITVSREEQTWLKLECFTMETK